MKRVDLCVIGSGPGGEKAAVQAAKLGKSVCVVEARDRMGGVAVNTGTIPSKALREMIRRLVGATAVSPEMRDSVVAFRPETMKRLWGDYEQIVLDEGQLVHEHLVSNGVASLAGTARFVDANVVEVACPDGTIETVQADFVLIAVGTEPTRPEGIPFDHENVITTDELLLLDRLPHSMIIVGGGVIGTEYASMLALLGIRITLVEGRDRLLEFADSELVEALQFHLRREGVTLRLGEKLVRIETRPADPGSRSEDGTTAEAILESGKRLHADCILYCIGRQGSTLRLGLENIGLEADLRGRIAVDASFRTKVPNVFAVGDVIGFPALASTSMDQGRIAACNMFGVASASVGRLLPFGIYSVPEISMVGSNEGELTAAGVPYECGIARYSEIARGKILGDETGMLKLIFHADTRALLGVHAIGTGATELVHVGQAVMAFDGKIDYFVDTVFNYPTLAECYKVAAFNGLNRLRDV